jgi:anti-sigma regulatory factor (Ser/Thr protein kinase)
VSAAAEYTAPRELEHEAFVYASDEEYVRVLAPLVCAAQAAGDEVFVVVPERNAHLLRRAVGGNAAAMHWIEAAEWYLRPARTLAGYDGTLRRLRPATSACVIGEVQFGRTPGDWLDWTAYEAVLNRVLARYPARVVCPYDARTLPPQLVADARRTHPHLLDADRRVPSAGYTEPESLVAGLPFEAPLPQRPPDLLLDEVATVASARRAWAAAVGSCGLPSPRLDELTVGVSEVLTNALEHGGAPVRLRAWLGDEVITVVEDAGRGADDPLLGLRVPEPGGRRGYGLWLARQVFDRTVVSRSPHGGLLVWLATAIDGNPGEWQRDPEGGL